MYCELSTYEIIVIHPLMVRDGNSIINRFYFNLSKPSQHPTNCWKLLITFLYYMLIEEPEIHFKNAEAFKQWLLSVL